MQELPNTLVVGISVALISGVFSLVGLIISKEQKLSDFRQAWIDALREDISDFVSYAIQISAYISIVLKPIFQEDSSDIQQAIGDSQKSIEVKKRHDERMREYFEATRGFHSGINVCSTRIKLRINDSPHEIEANDLLRAMNRMEKIFGSKPADIEDQAVHDLIAEIERISRPLLKKEWERVKKGERTYRVAKTVSLVFSGFAILFVLGLAVSAPAYLLGYFSATRNISGELNRTGREQILIQQQVEARPCGSDEISKP